MRGGGAQRPWRSTAFGAVLFGAMLGGGACAKAPTPGPASGQETSKATPFAETLDASLTDAHGDAPSASVANADAAAPMSLRDALLLQDWPRARVALSSLPSETQKAPLYRYAAARIARALDDHEGVLRALVALESDLPELRGRILELRAESAAISGPYEVATEIWSQQGGARAQLRAATVFAKTGDAAGLSRAVSQVLADGKRTAKQETEARALRIGVPALAGMDDARWLFTHAPGHSSAKAVASVFERESELRKQPRQATDAELKQRMAAWARTGNVDEALGELEHLQKSNAVSWSRQQFCQARAQLLYSARSKYTEAASTYATCAALGGKEQPENLFYEARSLARANQDDLAIKKYAELAKRYPRSPFAAQAMHLRARLYTLNGNYAEAAKAWDALPAGEDRDRLRALSHLLAGHAKTAEEILSHLTSGRRDRGRSPGAHLRLRELHALALDAAGETSSAVAEWRAIVREDPLSYAGQVARARLDARKIMPEREVPQLSPAVYDFESKVVRPIARELEVFFQLVRLGLGDEAEEILRTHAFTPATLSMPSGEGMCEAYRLTGRAKSRFRLLAPNLARSTSSIAHDCHFPRPFVEIMEAASQDSVIPLPFSFAIMRTESAFDPEVHSPAAAVGLMQLLPDTARRVGEKAHLPAEPLEDARVNIFLGVRYLAELADELKAPLPLVAAAYNAGPEAVQRWRSHLRPASPSPPPSSASSGKKVTVEMDTALFCELIPYTETRAYVFQVMESYAHYAQQPPQHGQTGHGAVAAFGANAGLNQPLFSLALPPL